MFALHFHTISGDEHSAFFRTREDRVKFMCDPIIFGIVTLWKVPIECDNPDSPVIEGEFAEVFSALARPQLEGG